MAGVSTKEIKNRIRSMESTKQITKAMEMVASSKLRKAQNMVQNSRPYFQALLSTIRGIAASSGDLQTVYLRPTTGERTLFLVIAGDRGLAGGYNSNVLKLCHSQMDDNTTVLPVGKKALEFFKARKKPIYSEAFGQAEQISVSDCFTVAKQLCKAFSEGKFDRIMVGYTDFVSVLSQSPRTVQLLPLPRPEQEETTHEILYEPDGESVLEAIVPEFVGGALYGALCESRASEQAARRTAMDSATSNAEEMIADLSLRYNRARQAAITQEITEIVAGG